MSKAEKRRPFQIGRAIEDGQPFVTVSFDLQTSDPNAPRAFLAPFVAQHHDQTHLLIDPALVALVHLHRGREPFFLRRHRMQPGVTASSATIIKYLIIVLSL